MNRKSAKSGRSGVVLIVVLVAIVLLSLAGYAFAELMFAEREAAWAHGRSLQARASVASGVAWMESLLAQPGAIEQAGGWQDNPAMFRGVLVSDGPIDRDRSRFTLISPRVQYGAVAGVRYGLQDEAAKLNLNTLLLLEQSSSGGGAAAGSSPSAESTGGTTAGSSAASSSGSRAQQALMVLPGMTVDVADAILDWLDSDDSTRTNGAERDYYSGLSPAYAPKNGPLHSVEELLLVRGVTPELLFGPDLDRNGFVDAQESSGSVPGAGSGVAQPAGGTSTGATLNLPPGAMNQGWAGYLTVYSQESNLRSDGQLKININSSDLEALFQALSAAFDANTATFIVGFRQGRASGSNTGGQSCAGAWGKSLDFTKAGSTMFASPLDLVGCNVQVTFKGDQEATTIASPFDPSPSALAGYASKLFDNLTIVPAIAVPGRINVNQATLPTLMSLPGMDSITAEQVLAAQQTASTQLGSDRRYATWLFTEGILPLDAMKRLMPYVTGEGRVFRAQVIGHFDRSGPTDRVEVVVDATTSVPRLLLWRELSQLGPGYSARLLGPAGNAS